MPVIGVAKSSWTIDQVRARAEESVTRHGGLDREAFATLMRSLRYTDGDYGDEMTFHALGDVLGTASQPVHYLAIPPKMFGVVFEQLARTQTTPSQTIAIGSFVKVPGELLKGEQVELIATDHVDPIEITAYEELLTDAIHGISSRFARQDYVEEAWRIVDPVLDDRTPVFEYDPGSWGPAEADRLVSPPGGWVNLVAR